MAVTSVDEYLAGVPEPQRSTLAALRATLRDLLPEAEETISYGVPAFRQDGKVVAGYAAFTHHCAYLPHSGTVLPAIAAELAGYTRTKSSLHFPVDQSLPTTLVHTLVAARLAELAAGNRR